MNVLFTHFCNPNHLALINKDMRSCSLIQINTSALCFYLLSIFSSKKRYFFFLHLELIDAPCSCPIPGPIQLLSYSVLSDLCNFSYGWSTGVIPSWFTFTASTHYIFVFMLGFESFLMSYRKILAMHSTLVNPAQNQVEELFRAPFGGRQTIFQPFYGHCLPLLHALINMQGLHFYWPADTLLASRLWWPSFPLKNADAYRGSVVHKGSWGKHPLLVTVRLTLKSLAA